MTLIHRADVSAVGVGEHEELVSQKIHLQYSLFRGHGLYGKRLRAYAELAFFGNIAIFLLGYAYVVAQPFRKPCFVLSDLTLNAVHAAVERVHESGAFVLAAEKERACADRNLYALDIAHARELDSGFCLFGKILVKFAEFFFNVVRKVPADFNFAGVDRDLHNITHPFL